MSRERDRQLEQALKRQLRASGMPDSGPSSEGGCVDPETLAAWADNGLDAAQMSAVELHVSTCARCQAIVAVAARSAPVVAPAVDQGWLRFPRWVLAPVAAAAAITIWMIVPQDTMQAPPSAPQSAVESKNEAAEPAREVAPAPQPEAAAQAAKERADAPAAPPPAPAALDRPTAATAERLQAPPPRLEERIGAAVGAAASAPAPPSPPVPAIADTTLQKSARFAAGPIEIISTDPASRWRIVNGSIERSEDSGASWIPIRAPGGESFTGGTSPSRSVCWLIGSSGLVMVSADGVAFARVPLPERVDVVAIEATDARSATVTTADGRRFRTDDSGRTWRPIQA